MSSTKNPKQKIFCSKLQDLSLYRISTTLAQSAGVLWMLAKYAQGYL